MIISRHLTSLSIKANSQHPSATPRGPRHLQMRFWRTEDMWGFYGVVGLVSHFVSPSRFIQRRSTPNADASYKKEIITLYKVNCRRYGRMLCEWYEDGLAAFSLGEFLLHNNSAAAGESGTGAAAPGGALSCGRNLSRQTWCEQAGRAACTHPPRARATAEQAYPFIRRDSSCLLKACSIPAFFFF